MFEASKTENETESAEGKDELAQNAKAAGAKSGEEAVEDYVDGEESYTRDPDTV